MNTRLASSDRIGADWRWSRTEFGTLGVSLALFLLATSFEPLRSHLAALYAAFVILTARFATGRQVLAGGALATVAALLSPLVHGAGSARALDATIQSLLIVVICGASWSRIAARVHVHDSASGGISEDRIQVVWNARGIVTHWGFAAVQAYGWSASAAVGQPVHVLLRTEFPEGKEAAMAALARTGAWHGTLTHFHQAGEPVEVDVAWTSCDLNGPLEVRELASDRRDRALLQRQLAARERLKRTLFDDAPIPMILEDWSGIKAMLDDLLASGVQDLDAYLASHPEFIARAQEQHFYLDANRATMAMFGARSKEQLLNVMTTTLPKAPDSDSEILRAFAKGDRLAHGERTLMTMDGRNVTILWQVDLTSGSAEHLLFTAIDITERKAMEEALLNAQAELTHTSRAALLGEMVASIAHEVNQPLAAIGIYAESARRWLHRAEPNLSRTGQSLDNIAKSAQHAGEVVRRIKGFVRREKPEFARLGAQELLSDTAFLVQREASSHRVALKFDVAPQTRDVSAVKVQIQQVLVNLVMNAVHALTELSTPDGQIKVQVRNEGDDLVAIEVTDNGPGIAAENLDRIFTPFFSTRSDGLGLGLALSRSIVEAHGGRISVTNRNPGASFAFTLKAFRELP